MVMSEWMGRLFGSSRSGGDAENWLTISDLMSGLMMVFLFISVTLMRSAFLDRDRIREVAVAYRESQVAIDEALRREFKNDLEKWDAEIDSENLTFEFQSPEVLFEAGDITLRLQFAAILNDFFPEYLRVLREFESAIDEVRIEGHTSSDWVLVTEDEAYFNNMRLSQGRTRSVLEHVYTLTTVPGDRNWGQAQSCSGRIFGLRALLWTHLEAKILRRPGGFYFRVVTNAETQIRMILEQ